jgi:ribosome-associated protein
MIINADTLIKELSFKAIRSSGSGGQHVNKVSSKIELSFNLQGSLVLSDAQKERLIVTLKNRLTKDLVLMLQCDESRSQHKNKTLVTQRFLQLIKGGLHVPKKRKPTKIPRAVIAKRLKNKNTQSVKKVNRKKPDID